MKKKLLITTVITIIIAGSIFYFTNKSDSSPEIPTFSFNNDSNASAEYLKAYHSFQYFREMISKHPNDPKNYVELAHIFLQESRVTGNHHLYLPKARLLIDEALSKNPDYFDANVTKAQILMTLHHFNEAKDLISKTVKKNQYSSAAYGIYVDALVETGNYEKAVQMCDKLLNLRPDLRSYARASYLRELYGKNSEAIKAMKLAADAGMYGQENRAWTLYNLGNLYLHEGKIDTALFIYKGILQERPGYSFALGGIAEVKALQKNYPEAIKYFAESLQSAPNHIFMSKLADLYKSIGDTEAEKDMIPKVLSAFEQHKQDGYNTDLEFTRFCSDHKIKLKESLEAAEREFNRRPKNIDALDAYAWALFKNGKSNEALPIIERAMRLNTKRSIIHFHAAKIFSKLNNNEKALKYLKIAMSEDPNINILYVNEAGKMLNSLEGMASLK